MQGLHSLGACERLRGGPVERDVPLFEDEHAVGIQGVVHEMRHVHDGDAALAKGIHDGADAGTALGVEHGAGLVEQQDLWLHGERAGDGDVHGERAGDGDALGLAAGQVGGVA